MIELASSAPHGVDSTASAQVELRIDAGLFTVVRNHVEDLSIGEQSGFLLCRIAQSGGEFILIAGRWMPVPDEHADRSGIEQELAWPAMFNAQAIDAALQGGFGLVLVHSHGLTHRPRLSAPDVANASRMFPPISRILSGRLSGSVVLGRSTAVGRFWKDGQPIGELDHLRVVGTPLERWQPGPSSKRPSRLQLDRQTRALGSPSDAQLADATVAVIGLSGGGSHVFQQLAHQGVGTLIGVDDQLVEDVQLGRMVGATRANVGSFKTEVMGGLAKSINPEASFIEIRERFPSWTVREALKKADVVIACVDSFAARQQINAFCRRYHLPLIDVGMNIRTGKDGKLVSASGQVVMVLPESSCLQCGPLLSDAVLARDAVERPPGYDLNPDAVGEPQVASMNAVLASEAVNCVLDLITGFARGGRGPGWWQYDGRRGILERCDLPPQRRNCPACAEWGQGDVCR